MPFLIWQLILFLLVGSIAGLLGGLLGIGGGTIIVPCLYFLFKYSGLPQADLMQLAIGTSLASIVFSTFSSARAHNKRGAVDKKVIKRLLPAILTGCLVGGKLAELTVGLFLEIFFGLFAIALGVYFLKAKHSLTDEGSLPSFPLVDISAFLIASISSIVGIGGGVMLVPYLHAHRFHEKKAIGTSASLSVAISLSAACFYLYFGLDRIHEPLCLGYIYLPAFICLSLSSYLLAPFGAKLAHTLATPHLKKIFAGVMLIIGTLMIFKG